MKLLILSLVTLSSLSSFADSKCTMARKFLDNHELASPNSAIAFISSKCHEFQNDKDSVFRIGSLTKPILAIGVAKAFIDNDQTLFEPVSTFIPELDFLNDKLDHKLTSMDLLTHISGIPSRVDGDLEQGRDYIIQKLKDLRPEQFASYGSNYNYSNIGYMILGMILEKLTQKSVDEYLSENIFKPLKMNSTSFKLTDKISNKLVTGYKFGGHEKSKDIKLKGHLYGWGLYSTANDLGNFLKFLLGHSDENVYQTIFSKEIASMMTVPFITKDGKNIASMIMKAQTRSSNSIASHTGLIDGFNSSIIIDKENDFGTIILSNEFSKSALLGNHMFYDYLSTGLEEMFFKTDAKACMVQEMFGPGSFVCLEVPEHIKSQVPDYRVWK